MARRAAAVTTRSRGGAKQARAEGAGGVLTAYEGASQSGRTQHWHAPTTSANDAVLPNLQTLRNRSRAAVRNNGIAKSINDKLVTQLIGTGITLLSQAEDVALRPLVQALWNQWTDQADADGVLDFYGLQSLIVRGWLEGGDMFVRLRPRLPGDGLVVPLQLQVIEPELCPHNHNETTANGNRIRAGIEFDSIGRRVAYWFHPTRPGDQQDFDRSELRRIPASSVIHLYNPLRAGQLRGVPHLSQALLQLFELDKFVDATLIKQQLSAMFVAFLKLAPTVGSGATNTLTAGLPTPPASTGAQEPPAVTMRPGYVNTLMPGEDIDFADPPKTEGFADFVKLQLRMAGSASSMPYEVLTGDMTGHNDRTMRVLLNDFRRMLQAWQHQIIAFQFCRPVYQAWLYRAFLADALPLPSSYAVNPEPYARVKWMPQAWPYIHPVQDVQAAVEENRAGFKSLSDIVSEKGEDPEMVAAQIAEDNKRADKLGLKLSSDGRQPKNGPATTQPEAATV
jgi:lambda family phage portal protein